MDRDSEATTVCTFKFIIPLLLSTSSGDGTPIVQQRLELREFQDSEPHQGLLQLTPLPFLRCPAPVEGLPLPAFPSQHVDLLVSGDKERTGAPPFTPSHSALHPRNEALLPGTHPPWVTSSALSCLRNVSSLSGTKPGEELGVGTREVGGGGWWGGRGRSV